MLDLRSRIRKVIEQPWEFDVDAGSATPDSESD
jgi:hypothetical protein